MANVPFMPIPEHEPLPATTPASPSPPATATAASGPAPPPGKWGPYSCAADFTTNMAAILVALFCVLILAVAANAFARHFLRRRRRAVGLPVAGTGCKEVSKISIKAIPMPVLVFSRRETSLAGDGPPECAICLSEFADGDRVRVIPACNHGFHVSCVETWLVSRPSCPTCRSSCKADAGDSGNSAANHACRVAEPMRRSSTVEERATTVPSPEDRATMEEP